MTNVEVKSSSPALGHRPGVRLALILATVVLSIAATMLVAYELAVARVPEHRARLERLVQSQTGLDVKFNELSLRWGWYGPEAVFVRVELGEPGRSNVLMRAPQLIVGVDAWKTLRAGQLVAGRITLIEPDIDLERIMRATPAAAGRIPERAAASRPAGRASVLERWRGGRIELQGGTLRVPDPGGSANLVTVNIRRASLRRSEGEWNGFGLVYLPERLGRAARVAVQLQGDLARHETWSGGLRFDGARLSFAGWRDMLGNLPAVARHLPAMGDGDVNVNLTLKNGRIEKANGQIKASDVTFRAPAWSRTWSAELSPPGSLHFAYLAGDWRLLNRAHSSQLQIDELVLQRGGTPLPRIAVEFSAGHIRGTAQSAPLAVVADIAHLVAPEFLPTGVALQGTARDIDVDWNAARPVGERLATSAQIDAAGLVSPGHFALRGLPVSIVGSENRMVMDVQAPGATLTVEPAADDRLPEPVRVTAALELTRTDSGWRLATDELRITHDDGHVVLVGALTGGDSSGVASIDAHGTLAHADVSKLQRLFSGRLREAFGEAAGRLNAGRIEEARFELEGPVDSLLANDAFKGSLQLKNAHVAAAGSWPETGALDARIEWNGPRMRASVDAGQVGAFKVEALQAQWDASGTRDSRVSGRARAPVQDALAWVREHPELQAQVPHMQDLVARGDALVDFDVTVPAAAKSAPRARIATVLDGVSFRLAPDLPPVESLRGSLAFDGGRLQRSTLTASWLGGPLTLKLSERRGRLGSSIAVQAQGYVDARKLVALSELKDLPEVYGETPWIGEFLYTAPTPRKAARWQGKADSALVGIASSLPLPFAKAAAASLPLHVEISGTPAASELRVNLADRLRSTFALKEHTDGSWQIARGAVRVGGGNAVLPSQDIVAIQGRMKRFDLPAYLVAWRQLNAAGNSPVTLDLDVDDMALGNRLNVDAHVTARQEAQGAQLRVESSEYGTFTGVVMSGTRGLAIERIAWTHDSANGEGHINCAADLHTCKGTFDIQSDAPAEALAQLGFRAELAAEKGALSGELTWQPEADRSWLETVNGRIDMRFEDGNARGGREASGRPFALLTVPALLTGMMRGPNVQDALAGTMRFKRLTAAFDLRDGEALTSDLHFDGDAEILMRGRTGLLAHDYDHEVWVLRGEERIPASLRKFAAAPRMAAAWLALREIISADAPDRSRVVLHLRGSWSEPVVSTN